MAISARWLRVFVVDTGRRGGSIEFGALFVPGEEDDHHEMGHYFGGDFIELQDEVSG